MAVFVVTWKLNKAGFVQGSVLVRFLEQLTKFEHMTDALLDNVTWISTAISADELANHLGAALDSKDALFVSKVCAEDYHGLLEEATWHWIADRI